MCFDFFLDLTIFSFFFFLFRNIVLFQDFIIFFFLLNK